ncbi:MAG: C40 family peptidase, partial [Acidobacteriota bacterium]|nr:C40 family peptidase [Acidobacteriota bacterium]
MLHPSEAAERARVVAEALSWLGTPYHHRARLKGVGVDCAQLPIAVFADAGLIEAFDTGDYPADWHLHRDEERYAGFVLRYADGIAQDEAQPGDLVLFRYGRAFSHGAILTAPGQVVHAVRKDRSVVLGDLDRDVDLLERPRRYFSFWARSSSERQRAVAPCVDSPRSSSERQRAVAPCVDSPRSSSERERAVAPGKTLRSSS